MKLTLMETKIVEALKMLNSVKVEYFYNGEMQLQHAFARIVLALELLSDVSGFETDERLVELFFKNQNHEFVLFPSDSSIGNHVANLAELQKGLAGAEGGFRSKLMFIGNDDPKRAILKIVK